MTMLSMSRKSLVILSLAAVFAGLYLVRTIAS